MNLDVTGPGAFLAGLLSFISPCVLPLVPPYLAFIAGLSLGELTGEGGKARPRSRIMLAALMFVAGFATVFVALGATASALGRIVMTHAQTLSIAAGIVIIVMGLHFLGVIRIPLLYRTASVDIPRRAGLAGAYVVGLAFAFGWTPCVGPVLAAILMVAATEQSALEGARLLFIYAMGLGIPFLAAALFAGPFMRWAAKFRRHLGVVEKTMGLFLVATGIVFLTGQMSAISYWLLDVFPVLGRIG